MNTPYLILTSFQVVFLAVAFYVLKRLSRSKAVSASKEVIVSSKEFILEAKAVLRHEEVMIRERKKVVDQLERRGNLEGYHHKIDGDVKIIEKGAHIYKQADQIQFWENIDVFILKSDDQLINLSDKRNQDQFH